MGDLTKSFLYSWCGRNKVIPQYKVESAGTKQRAYFVCEVSVIGYEYVGIGVSPNKKYAQRNAARDFILYLIKEGHLSASEVPIDLPSALQSSEKPTDLPDGRPVAPHAQMGSSSQNHSMQNKSASANETSATDSVKFEEQKTEEAEDLDRNPEIHGNWTLDNSKNKIHQYFHQHEMEPDYKYSQVGPNNSNRGFCCELSVYVRELGRTLSAKEYGPSKTSSSKSCARSLVRQLYHLKVIDAHISGSKKKDKLECNVVVDSQLMQDIDNFLKKINVYPKEVPENYDGTEPVSLILERNVNMNKPSRPPHAGGVVLWFPPQPNWNPWTSCNINEGPLAAMSLHTISKGLKLEYNARMEKDESLKQMLELRKELPVYQFKNDILEAVQRNSVVIIRGATGCGKTTQIPQYILDDYISENYGAFCCIVVTQPRHICAISVAERISEERAESLGNTVGFSGKFESCFPRPYGSILFSTVGVLMRKLEGGLRGVSHVIVDEIQDREVNTDFFLAVLRDMVRSFPAIRLILMSATIDTTLFQKYFGNCPIIEVTARAFPVQDYFLEDCIQMLNFIPPPVTAKRKKDEEIPEPDEVEENMNKVIGPDYSQTTKQSMARLNERELPFELIDVLIKYIKDLNVPGTILIFLPGWNFIFALMLHLQQHPLFSQHEYSVLALHSQVSREELQKIFKPVPQGVTKVVLATDIAETVITVNDVVFVIDSCKMQRKIFTSHSNMTNYVTIWASKINLAQRKGRAGHVRPGFAFHLCSRARFEKLEQKPEPDIFRTPLHELALAIKLLHLGDIGKFLSKTLQPPPVQAVIEAEVLLREMGALDQWSELTPLGKILARLPIEPRLGKMLVLACIFNCAKPLCIMTAQSYNFRDPFDIRYPKKLTDVHNEFYGDRWSDHLIMLNIFMQWENKYMQGESVEQAFCEQRSLNRSILHLTHDVRSQLRDLLIAAKFPESCFKHQSFCFEGSDAKLDMVVALLCSGFYPNVCYHRERRRVITADGKLCLIHKGSICFTHLPPKFPSPCFVFSEKILKKYITKSISCKQMTMVSPLHILLFGCRKVECVKGSVCIDGWYYLKMNPQVAAKIVALHPVIENLILQVADNPEILTDLGPQNTKLIELLRRLCGANACKCSSEELLSDSTASVREGPEEPPRKMIHLSADVTSGVASRDDSASSGHFRSGSSYDSHSSGCENRGGAFGSKGSGYSGGFGSSNDGYSSQSGGFESQTDKYGGQGTEYGSKNNGGGRFGGQKEGGLGGQRESGFGGHREGYSGQGGGYNIQGDGFSGQDSGFSGQGSGFTAQSSRFTAQGSRFTAQGGEFTAQGGEFTARGDRHGGQGSGFSGRGDGFSSQSGGYAGQSGSDSNKGYVSDEREGIYSGQRGGYGLHASGFVGSYGRIPSSVYRMDTGNEFDSSNQGIGSSSAFGYGGGNYNSRGGRTSNSSEYNNQNSGYNSSGGWQ